MFWVILRLFPMVLMLILGFYYRHISWQLWALSSIWLLKSILSILTSFSPGAFMIQVVRCHNEWRPYILLWQYYYSSMIELERTQTLSLSCLCFVFILVSSYRLVTMVLWHSIWWWSLVIITWFLRWIRLLLLLGLSSNKSKWTSG